MDSPFEELRIVTEENHKCKGKIFRCKINTFLNKKSEYVRSTRMTLLKRESCAGCEKCGFLMDDLQDFVANQTDVIIDKPVHGSKYQLIVTNIQKDWETGYVDDWDMEFKLIGK